MTDARHCLTIYALLALALLISCAPSESGRRVNVAQFGDFFLYAPLYVAIDAGFMERNGLDVAIINTGGDATTWATVLSGQADFGIADPTFVAIAGQRGRPGVVVASLVEGVPFWGVTFDSSLEQVDAPSDLGDLTVATFPSPSTAFALQRDMFLDGGLQPKIREAAPGTGLALLRAGEADISLELEPTVSQAVSQGARVLYSLNDYYPHFAITGVTVTPNTLRDSPDLVISFVCSLQQAMDFIRSNQDSSLKLLSQRFSTIEGTVASRALDRVVQAGIVPPDAITEEESWSAAIRLRMELGDLSDTASFQSFVDNAAAHRAARECRLN